MILEAGNNSARYRDLQVDMYPSGVQVDSGARDQDIHSPAKNRQNYRIQPSLPLRIFFPTDHGKEVTITGRRRPASQTVILVASHTRPPPATFLQSVWCVCCGVDTLAMAQCISADRLNRHQKWMSRTHRQWIMRGACCCPAAFREGKGGADRRGDGLPFLAIPSEIGSGRLAASHQCCPAQQRSRPECCWEPLSFIQNQNQPGDNARGLKGRVVVLSVQVKT